MEEAREIKQNLSISLQQICYYQGKKRTVHCLQKILRLKPRDEIEQTHRIYERNHGIDESKDKGSNKEHNSLGSV